MIEAIPFGHENAISLEEVCARTGLSKRNARRAIEQANITDDIIINNGFGYFRYSGEEDEAFFKAYLSSEASRAKAIMHKVRKMALTKKVTA